MRDIDVVAQQFWGERHLDDAVLRRRRDEPGTWANDTISAAYALTDVQFNAVAQVDGGAQLLERVVYEPYGRALHHRPHDVDGDGDADANDQQIISGLASPATGIADAGYRVEADLNRDGVIDANDSAHFNALGFAAGLGAVVSDAAAADNAFGFAGYHFDRETRHYHVRHRVYETSLGRFMQRDPLGYADGMSLYEYVGSSPFVGLDPMGLKEIWWGTPAIQPNNTVTVTQWQRSSVWLGLGGSKLKALQTTTVVGEGTVPGTGGLTAKEVIQSRGYGGVNRNDAFANSSSDAYRAVSDAFHGRGPREAAELAEYSALETATGGGLVAGVGAARAVDDIAGAALRALRNCDEAAKAAHAKQILGREYSSAILGKNLEAMGIVRPEGAAAHHIVAGNARKAAEARRILAREGIDINDAVNGVFLPPSSARAAPPARTHSRLHTNAYYDAVTAALRRAPEGTARDVLAKIGRGLRDGTFP